MESMFFTINVQSKTVAPEFVGLLRPRAWLIPPTRVSGPSARAVASLRARRWTVVDNGGFDVASRCAKLFEPRAKEIRVELKALREQLGRVPTSRDLPRGVSSRLERLVSDLQRFADDTPPDSPFEERMAFEPDAVVGAEHSLAAAWGRLRISPTLMPDRRRRIARANRRVASAGKREASTVECEYFAVASCLDHDTAFDAGATMARAGFGHLAVGFGAYMDDDSTVESVVIDGRARLFSRPLPTRYVASATVLRGLFSGYRSVARRSPESVHLLGLGTPIMLAIASVAAGSCPRVTADATSPIQDAVQGIIYETGGWVKVRAERAAWQFATGRRDGWTCRCPFCAAYHKRYPIRPKVLRAQWAGRGDAAVRRVDLRSRGRLFDGAGILGEPGPGEQRRAMSTARIGHNHAALQHVCSLLGAHARKGDLERFVSRAAARYSRSALDHYAAAVDVSLRIVRTGDI